MIFQYFTEWQDRVNMLSTSRLFIRCINLAGLGLILWMLPISDMVWGEAHFSILYHDFTGIDALPALLRESTFRMYYWVFILAYLSLATIAVFGLSTMLSRLMTWFVFLILYYGNYDVSNGGWHMLIQLHLLSVFLVDPTSIRQLKLKLLASFIHNVTFRVIWIQIALMYFTSGVHKLFGHYWLSGEALLIVLNRPEFSLPFIMDSLGRNSLILKLLTYSALAYQLLFPLLIWFRQTRSYILAAGFIFHLVILFALGITDFAILLISAYSIFLDPKLVSRLQSRFSFVAPFKK